MKPRAGEVRLDGSDATGVDTEHDDRARRRRVENVAPGANGKIGLSMRTRAGVGVVEQRCLVCNESSSLVVEPKEIEHGVALESDTALAWLEVFQKTHAHEETFS